MNPFISIVVPIRNEEATIERLTRSLLDQDYPHDRYEILMCDGGSTDRTRAILSAIDPTGRIRILENPGRTAPAALNVAIGASRGEIVTRVDGHSYVAPDYLTRIVAVMEETGESVVGGPVRMLADTPFRRALVEALYAKIAVGAVPYRTLAARTHVESLQTGSFKRAVLDRVGPFDESLAVVEDLDMNTRIRKAGFTLLLDPSIRFWYLPRPSLGALWRQITTVGLVKARILRKHPDIFKWKYVLPSVFVVAAIVFAGALAGSRAARLAGASFFASYAAVIVAFALSKIPRAGAQAWRLLFILPTLHFGYGIGFLSGATEKLLGRTVKPPGAP
ncbi:MAG TPA: glycosyltransferase family 2 protein [Candidatus Polarisedimenticolaceae bacterium]|nr:glycosyltransferase family 2 protein [Candidatus Polarisedimenticolaceae bacterium]